MYSSGLVGFYIIVSLDQQRNFSPDNAPFHQVQKGVPANRRGSKQNSGWGGKNKFAKTIKCSL